MLPLNSCGMQSIKPVNPKLSTGSLLLHDLDAVNEFFAKIAEAKNHAVV